MGPRIHIFVIVKIKHRNPIELHYTHGIAPKRPTSGGAHLREVTQLPRSGAAAATLRSI